MVEWLHFGHQPFLRNTQCFCFIGIGVLVGDFIFARFFIIVRNYRDTYWFVFGVQQLHGLSRSKLHGSCINCCKDNSSKHWIRFARVEFTNYFSNMKHYNITVFIRGRKKRLCGVRAFPASLGEDAVREAMVRMLLYYYFENDIMQVDVVIIKESPVNGPEQISKKLLHVC